MRPALLVLLAVLASFVSPLSATAQASPRCNFDGSYPRGTVIELDGAPHLWVLEGGELHWAGDTRALAGRTIRWDSRCAMDVGFARRAQKGDPWLSAGMVKVGDPIYLAKWETEDGTPTLLHIQSIADVELFGITGSNYGRFVLERAEWQQLYGFNTDNLRRGELAATGAPAAGPPAQGPPAPGPAATATPATAPTAVATPTRPSSPSFGAIQEPRPFPEFPCLAANPSCARDPWWVEWNELPGTEMVTYSFAPGLVTQAKYVEVIWLLWLWPEGRALLQDAAANGVSMITLRPGDLPSTTLAGYASRLNAVGVSPTYTDVSTWMLADTVVHELKHASDDRRGLLETTYSGCVAAEQRAFAVERRYIQWIAAWRGGLPSESQVAARLSPRDLEVFRQIRFVQLAPDLNAAVERTYQTQCATRGYELNGWALG